MIDVIAMAALLPLLGDPGSSQSSRAVDPQIFEYRASGIQAERFGDPLFIMIGEKPTNMAPFVGAGSDFHKATFCQSDDSMVCVTSPVFSFAAPKNRLRQGDTWRLGELNFEVLRQLSFEALGIRTKAYRIVASDALGERWAYLYSTEHGLLAIDQINASNKDVVVEYILTKMPGFGAAKN